MYWTCVWEKINSAVVAWFHGVYGYSNEGRYVTLLGPGLGNFMKICIHTGLQMDEKYSASFGLKPSFENVLL